MLANPRSSRLASLSVHLGHHTHQTLALLHGDFSAAVVAVVQLGQLVARSSLVILRAFHPHIVASGEIWKRQNYIRGFSYQHKLVFLHWFSINIYSSSSVMEIPSEIPSYIFLSILQ